MVVNIYCLWLISTCVLILLWPVVWYLVSGELEPILPIMLPFVDANTTEGYIKGLVAQFLYALITLNGLLASDLTFGMLSLYSWPLVDLFCDHIEQMNIVLRTSRRLGKTKEMTDYVGNMLSIHKDIVE